MAIYSIYCLTNTKTNKVYIGKTVTTLESRLKGHLRDVAEGAKTRLHNSIRKYGIGIFKMEAIFNAFDEASLSDFEKHFIKEYDCCILDGRSKGYNMTRGGDGFTSETAKAVSAKMIEDGRHPFAGVIGSAMAKKLNKKKLAEGTHHLAGVASFDLHSRISKSRVATGTHNFQGPDGAAKTSANQKKLLAAGTHKLQGESGRNIQLKLLAEGKHSSQKVFTCPHCQRTGKGNLFKVWHFDNCKSLKDC